MIVSGTWQTLYLHHSLGKHAQHCTTQEILADLSVWKIQGVTTPEQSFNVKDIPWSQSFWKAKSFVHLFTFKQTYSLTLFNKHK